MNERESMIGYCGLYCGDCPMFKGRIADLARDLRCELRRVRFDKTAEMLSVLPFFANFKGYPECYQTLGGMVRMRCRRTCRARGGNPSCKVRACCLRKGLAGCWQCADFTICNRLRFLAANHGDAHLRNLRVLKRRGPAGFLRSRRFWYA